MTNIVVWTTSGTQQACQGHLGVCYHEVGNSYAMQFLFILLPSCVQTQNCYRSSEVLTALQSFSYGFMLSKNIYVHSDFVTSHTVIKSYY